MLDILKFQPHILDLNFFTNKNIDLILKIIFKLKIFTNKNSMIFLKNQEI